MHIDQAWHHELASGIDRGRCVGCSEVRFDCRNASARYRDVPHSVETTRWVDDASAFDQEIVFGGPGLAGLARRDVSAGQGGNSAAPV